MSSFMMNIFTVGALFLFLRCPSLTDHITTEEGRKNMLYLVKNENVSSSHSKTKLFLVWSPNKADESGGCEVYDDQNLIAEILSSASETEILTATEEEVKDILAGRECTDVRVRKKRQSFHMSASSSLGFRSMFHPNGYSSSGDYRNDYYVGSRLPSIDPVSSYGVRRENNNHASSSNRHQNYNSTITLNGQQQKNNTISAGNSTAGQRNTTDSSTIESTTEDNNFDIIFPGTKWCGAGDIAKSYDDLGQYDDTDRCCRAHDKCNDTIPAGQSKYNLTNTSPFTALSCQCDNDFFDCLENVNSIISNKIGGIYFNILRRQCYTYDYPPASTCKNYRSLLKIACKEYERNISAPKVYQWESPKLYRNLPVPGLKLPDLR